MGHVLGHLAARKGGAEGRHKEELADHKNQTDGRHAHQAFDRRAVAQDHVAGNGVQKHFQRAAGAVLGQHLDELNADHQVKGVLQKGLEGVGAAVGPQCHHLLGHRDGAEKQPGQNQHRDDHFKKTGQLRHLVPQSIFEPFLVAVELRAGQSAFLGGFVHGAPSFIPWFAKQQRLSIQKL